MILTNANGQPADEAQLNQVAQRLAGHAALNDSGGLDLMASVGGFRGIAEATVPALVFLLTFITTSNVLISAIWAVGLAALASLLRLLQKQPLTQALAGVFGVAVSAAMALMQDDARGYYVIGFYVSAAYGLVFVVSMLVKWPLMGLIYGWIRAEGVAWQKDLLRRRKYQIATLLMVLVFGSRLAIQLPLYWANDVVALGTARLVMGVPLYALVLWFGWLVSRPVPLGSTHLENESDHGQTADAAEIDPRI